MSVPYDVLQRARDYYTIRAGKEPTHVVVSADLWEDLVSPYYYDVRRWVDAAGGIEIDGVRTFRSTSLPPGTALAGELLIPPEEQT